MMNFMQTRPPAWLLVTLCAATGVPAGAASLQLDSAGNVLRLEQVSRREINDERAQLVFELEWGNLDNRPGVGLNYFDGFLDPEESPCTVINHELLDSGGDYDAGGDDAVVDKGPDYLSWRASSQNDTDGLTFGVTVTGEEVVHLRLGEWLGEFIVDHHGMVERSLTRSVTEWTMGGPPEEGEVGPNRANAWLHDDNRTVKIRWGNLDVFPSTPFETFDGEVTVVVGRAELSVTDTHSWESDGSYSSGSNDRILEDGPDVVRWEASVRPADGDGLNVHVEPRGGDARVRVTAGDFERVILISAVGDHNRANAWLHDDGRTIKIRWGNLDRYDNPPFEGFDGSAEIIEGAGTLLADYELGFEKGGDYAAGEDDRILEATATRVTWQASVDGDSDGLNIRVNPESERVKVRVKVGERTFNITVKSG